MTAGRAAILLAAALAVACASTPSASGAVRPGEAIARRKCGGCHRVPLPEEGRGHAALAALRSHGSRVALTPAESRDVERFYLAAE